MCVCVRVGARDGEQEEMHDVVQGRTQKEQDMKMRCDRNSTQTTEVSV